MTTIRLSDADRPFVPAADQRQDLVDFLAARSARDGRRMQELVASGRVVPLRAGLEVAIRDDGRIIHRERSLWVAAA